MFIFSSSHKGLIVTCCLFLALTILRSVYEDDARYGLIGLLFFLAPFLLAIELKQYKKLQFGLHALFPTLMVGSLAVYFFFLKHYDLMAVTVICWGGLLVFISYHEWKLHYKTKA